MTLPRLRIKQDSTSPICKKFTKDSPVPPKKKEPKKTLIALDLLLREAEAPETTLLIHFSRLVFQNNFLKTEFCGDIFHQTFGIAMGTPFAVTAVNAFMYYLEKDVVT